MMYQQVVARRYAKGLLLSAKKESLDRIEEELKNLVNAIFFEHKDLERLFLDPAFSPPERKAVIRRLSEKMSLDVGLTRFLQLLIDRDRMLLLPLIHEAFLSLVDELYKRVRVAIKSATPIDDQEISQITLLLEQMSKKEVVAKASVVQELLGGIRVEMAGMIFDGTVRAKLDAIKSRLMRGEGI